MEEQEDQNPVLGRFEEFPALSDKNLMEPAGEWSGGSAADRPAAETRRRHHFHGCIAEKTFTCCEECLEKAKAEAA